MKTLIPTEHDEQCAVIKVWHMIKLNYPHAVLWATPNGGYRHRATGARLKREGVVPGVPDLFCCDRNKSPLWIELKRLRGGYLSSEQKNTIEKLRGLGHHVEVCRGHKEALNVIMGYLKGKVGGQRFPLSDSTDS